MWVAFLQINQPVGRLDICLMFLLPSTEVMFVVITAQCITRCRMREMDDRQTGAAGETDKDTTELPFHNFLSIVFSCCLQPCQLLFVSSLHMTCHQNRRIDQSTGVLARVVKESKILARFDWGFYYTAF